MFLFKKKETTDEERRCALCEYAEILENDRVYCAKKKKEQDRGGECSAFILDLLKKKPAAAPVFKGFDFEDV